MQHEGKKCIQVQQAFADGATLAELEQHIAYLRSLGAPGDARPRIGVNGDCEVTMMICAVLRRTLQVLHKCPKKEVERPGSGLRWLEFEGKSGMAEESADEVGPVLDAPEPAADSLPELQDKARAINARLLETETAGQDTALVSPVIERITRPTLTGEGRKAPALRFGDLRVQALAGATAAVLFTVTGITNKTLRGLMTGLLHRPYSMNQASYDLSRLARNGLITRIPGRNRYTLTRDGLLFACFYTKVYDHILRPLMAPGRPTHHPNSPRRSTPSTSSSPATHRPGTRPYRSLTYRHGPHPTARPHSSLSATHPAPLPAVTLRTNVKDVAPTKGAPKVP